MKAKLILNLVLILAVTAVALYAILQPKQAADQGTRISQLKREDITRITVERSKAAPIRIEKSGNGWRILAPFAARADVGQVDRILDITGASAKQKLPREDLARFDLEPPALSVTLNDQVIAFGRINDITNEQYVATSDAVYLLPPFYGYGIPQEAGKLASRKLLDDDEVPVAFDFGAYKVVRDDKGQWSAAGTLPSSGTPPTQDEFNRWADEWRVTYALSAEPFKGPASRQRVELRFQNGKTATLHTVPTGTGFDLVREDEKMLYRFGAEVGRRLMDPRATTAK
jgi:hypothetical protein